MFAAEEVEAAQIMFDAFRAVKGPDGELIDTARWSSSADAQVGRYDDARFSTPTNVTPTRIRPAPTRPSPRLRRLRPPSLPISPEGHRHCRASRGEGRARRHRPERAPPPRQARPLGRRRGVSGRRGSPQAFRGAGHRRHPRGHQGHLQGPVRRLARARGPVPPRRRRRRRRERARRGRLRRLEREAENAGTSSRPTRARRRRRGRQTTRRRGTPTRRIARTRQTVGDETVKKTNRHTRTRPDLALSPGRSVVVSPKGRGAEKLRSRPGVTRSTRDRTRNRTRNRTRAVAVRALLRRLRRPRASFAARRRRRRGRWTDPPPPPPPPPRRRRVAAARISSAPRGTPRACTRVDAASPPARQKHAAVVARRWTAKQLRAVIRGLPIAKPASGRAGETSSSSRDDARAPLLASQP